MQSTGIDPSGARAWCATLTLRPASEFALSDLRFPATLAQYPDRAAALRLGLSFPRTAQALCWQWALTSVSFAAPEWQTPAGPGELRAVLADAEAVVCEGQWLNMAQVSQRSQAEEAKGGQAGAPSAWQGVYALAQTVGVARAARAESGGDKAGIAVLSPSSWRSVALKALPFSRREIARKTEQQVCDLLLGSVTVLGPLRAAAEAARGGSLLGALTTADPRADLSAALCIGLAAAGLPWYAVTPVTDLAVSFAGSVPTRVRARKLADARAHGEGG